MKNPHRNRLGRRGTALALSLVFALVLTACGGGDGDTDDTPDPDPVDEPEEEEEEPADDPAEDEGEDEAAPEEPSMTVDDLEPLDGVFTWFPAFHSMAIFVADGAGYWDDLNLDVEMQRADSGASMYAMLNAGQTDWTNAGVDVVAQAQGEGRDIIHVFPAVTKMSLNFVARNEVLDELGITPDSPLEEKLEALTQMTVGYTSPNSPTDVYSRYLMGLGGIDPETEGDLISVGSPPNLIAALRTGQIDAFMLTPPSPNVPEIEGFGTIFIKSSVGETPTLNDFPYSGFSARGDWLEDETNQEKTVRFVAGLLLAADLIQNNPDEAIPHLAEYFPDLEQETLEVAFEDMIPSIPDDPYLTEEMVASMMDILVDNNIFEFSGTPDASEGVLYTNDYIAEAEQLLADLGMR